MKSYMQYLYCYQPENKPLEYCIYSDRYRNYRCNSLTDPDLFKVFVGAPDIKPRVNEQLLYTAENITLVMLRLYFPEFFI